MYYKAWVQNEEFMLFVLISTVRFNANKLHKMINKKTNKLIFDKGIAINMKNFTFIEN